MTAMIPSVKLTLPPHIDAERFMMTCYSAVVANPNLLNCERNSLLESAQRASVMGLNADGKEGAIVAYGSKAQFMPMVDGLMKLARNSGEISKISVQVVHENDDFDYEMGDAERIVHKPKLNGRGKIIAAYSIVHLKDGEISREVMGVDEMNVIRGRAKSRNVWDQNEGEMYKKTVFRRHYKRLPKSTDLDGVFDDENELYAAPEPEKTVETEPKPKGRSSRLQDIAAKAETQPVQEDAINGESREVVNDEDLPI
jgi:recombination protein RecT